MPALERISGGPFPSLFRLYMQELSRLKEVWIVREETLSDGDDRGGCSNSSLLLGQVQIGNCLLHLEIVGCPKLMVKLHFPSSLEFLSLLGNNKQLLMLSGQGQGSSSSSSSDAGSHSSREGSSLCNILPSTEQLVSLQISSCSALLQLPEWPMALRSLRALKVISYNYIISLPLSLKQLTSLQKLEVVDFKGELHQLPDWLGELRSLRSITLNATPSLRSLPQSSAHLTSLQELYLRWCDVLQLPEWLGELCSLREFDIWGLKGLTCLPQSTRHMVTLEGLHIRRCPGLTSLPEWIKDLSALQRLQIAVCPGLERRCERGKGEDWHLISHIPCVWSE